MTKNSTFSLSYNLIVFEGHQLYQSIRLNELITNMYYVICIKF